MSEETTQTANPTAPRKSPEGIIYVSDKAAYQAKMFAEREGKPTHGLRVSVKGGGCSGLSYVLNLEPEAKPGDKVITQNGINIFVDGKSLLFLAGTTLDFSDGLNGKGFVFNNPQAKSSCGCGNSFAV